MEGTLYRSKDDAAKSRIKKAVLKAMRGFEPEDKQDAWGSVFTYLRLDDLQMWAIEQYGSIIELGDGPSDAPICVVTEDAITAPELGVLHDLMDALKIDPFRVYKTSRTKATDGINTQLLDTILQSEIGFIRPDVVIFSGSFTGLDEMMKYLSETVPGIQVIHIDHISEMLGDSDESKNVKKRVWEALKNVTL